MCAAILKEVLPSGRVADSIEFGSLATIDVATIKVEQLDNQLNQTARLSKSCCTVAKCTLAILINAPQEGGNPPAARYRPHRSQATLTKYRQVLGSFLDLLHFGF